MERQNAKMNQTSESNQLLLRGGEVARELGISRALAFRWMQNGTLPVVRVPGARTVRVPRAALMAWIERRTQQVA
jgi:excisionase family DNA binding protein